MAKKSSSSKDKKHPIILVVDDDRALVDLTSIQLEHAGYQVLKAYDGLEAVKVTIQHNPDLILLDIMMPRMDGFQVCRFLKNYPPFDRIPIIFLTVRSGIGDRQRGLLRGGDDYLAKPFDFQEIQRKIDSLIKSAAERGGGEAAPEAVEKTGEISEMSAALKMGELLDENLFKLSIMEEVSRAVADAPEPEDIIKTLLIGCIQDIGLGFDRAIYLVKSEDGRKLVGHMGLGLFPEAGVTGEKWNRVISQVKEKTLGEIFSQNMDSFPFLLREDCSFLADLTLGVPDSDRTYDLTMIPGGEDILYLTHLITTAASRKVGAGEVRAVPVVARGQLVGALLVMNQRHRSPASVEDIKNLIILCNQVGLAFEKARLLKDQNRWTEELESLTNLNRSIIESAGVGIVYLDPGGTIVTWNRTMGRMADREIAEVLGRKFFELFPHLESSLVSQRMSRVVEARTEERVGHFEMRLGRKLGYFDIKMSPVIIREELQGVVLLFEDITRRVELENKHQETFQYLSEIVDYSADGIITTDLRGRIRTWNRGAESIFGYDEASVKGQSLGILFPSGEKAGKADILKKVSSGETVQDYEAVMFSSSGDRLFISLTATPLRKADGTIHAGSFFIRDITERKELFTQIVQTEKLASLGVMAAGMAHEINNPLTSIMMYSELLSLDGDLGEEARSNLVKIREEVDRISAIVMDLLVYSRTRDEEPAMVPIEDILKQAVVFTRRKSSTENVTIRQALEDPLPSIQGNPNEILEIFLNILLNGLDSLGDGGTLEIVAGVKNISLPEGDGEWILVKITDDGHGIPASEIPKIFDPFYTTKPPGKGTGLGLMVVSQLVEKYGGRIEVESRFGQGTTFSVFLPGSGT